MQRNSQAALRFSKQIALGNLFLALDHRSTGRAYVLTEYKLQFGRQRHGLHRKLFRQFFCFRRMNTAFGKC